MPKNSRKLLPRSITLGLGLLETKIPQVAMASGLFFIVYLFDLIKKIRRYIKYLIAQRTAIVDLSSFL